MSSANEWRPIRGKVIRVIDEYRLIIDVGWGDGVTTGMEFIVFEEGEEITDPLEQDRYLGKMEHVKARVEAEHVQKKFSVARSSIFSPSPTLAEISSAMSGVSGYVRGRRVKLAVSPTDICTLVTPDMTIKVGDKARQVREKTSAEE